MLNVKKRESGYIFHYELPPLPLSFLQKFLKYFIDACDGFSVFIFEWRAIDAFIPLLATLPTYCMLDSQNADSISFDYKMSRGQASLV